MRRLEKISEIPPDGGGFNDWPKNAKKLTKAEAAKAQNEMLFTFEPECTEFRQAEMPVVQMICGKLIKKMCFVPLRIFWRSDKTGLMAVKVPDCKSILYSEKVEWYHIGCEHRYQELSQAECARRGISHGGNCYHVEVCKNCGHINSYDSSG